ncbi:MAG: hypothetical protein ACRDGM_02565, partial [bacterium]
CEPVRVTRTDAVLDAVHLALKAARPALDDAANVRSVRLDVKFSDTAHVRTVLLTPEYEVAVRERGAAELRTIA